MPARRIAIAQDALTPERLAALLAAYDARDGCSRWRVAARMPSAAADAADRVADACVRSRLARDARMKHKVKRVHFVGIGGAGMSGIAEVLATQGYRGVGLRPRGRAR